MAAIYVTAPKGCEFKVGGKKVNDSTPIKVESAEHRIRKALSEGSLILFEETDKPKRGRPKSSPSFTIDDENENEK